MTHTRLPLALMLGTLALVIVVLVFLGFSSLDERQGGEIIIRDPRADATIVVSVAGAVATPGVYALGPGARVGDLLAAAGGPTDGADAERINPAALLLDGQQIIVPTRIPSPSGDPLADGAVLGDRAGTPAGAADPAFALVNLNTATAEELEALPGIGPVLAAAIIADREAFGPYQSVDDLVRVRGISTGIVEELRPLVTV